MTTRLTASLLLALLFVSSVPAPLSAATVTPAPNAPLSATSDEGDDEDNRDRFSSFRERYSSSVQRKVRQLDDDEVEHMPVPVLFARYASIYPDFGDPRGGGTREHEGQDILAPKGSFIVSPTEAVVTRTGKGGSAGIYVYTANPGGETFRYMHLDDIADGVKSGTVLKAGDLIGYVGNTGNAAGGPDHLHFEIRDGRKAIDPYPRIDGSWTRTEYIRIIENLIKILEKELRNAD